MEAYFNFDKLLVMVTLCNRADHIYFHPVFLATLRRHNCTMMIDRRKLITKLSLYGMPSFHFYRFHSHFLACTLRIRNLPKFSATSSPRSSDVAEKFTAPHGI